MNMTYDAVIFDMDGTLWDACPASARGWNIGLKGLGIDRKVSADDVRSVAGNPYDKCMDILFPGLQQGYPELRKTLEDCENNALQATGGEFYPGVVSGVKELAKRINIFLVSNCQKWYLDLFFQFSGLKQVFSGYDCNGLSGLPKNEMLSRIKVRHSMSNPVYIGDTSGDMEAANLADMEFIHAGWGFGKPEGQVKSAGSFMELMSYLRL